MTTKLFVKFGPMALNMLNNPTSGGLAESYNEDACPSLLWTLLTLCALTRLA
jgi:hypothetical protein